ncbi:MAG: GGDEF domain-containing protein [Ruminococcus sp.]|nr:GGDEF domain-containing protein [Ruminococcus sp.]
MKIIYGAINSLMGIIIIVLMIMSFIIPMEYKGSPYTDTIEYSDGWVYDTGDSVNTESIETDKKYIQKSISYDDISGRDICFVCRNANFTVFLDDENIYDFNPKGNNRKRGLYGEYIHTVPVPHFDGIKTIKIEFNNLDTKASVGFFNMALQDSGTYLANLARSDKGKFFICLTTFIIGMIVFAYGIVEQTFHGNMIETVCLGTFTMLIGAWTSPQFSLMFVFSGNSLVMRSIEYISLAIMPVPVITFAASVTKNFSNKIFIFCIFAATVNLFAQLTLSGADMFDYTEMLKFSHIIILMCITCIIFMFFLVRKREDINTKNLGYLIVSMSLIVFSGIVDMIRYYTMHDTDTAKTTRFSMPVFVTALIVYEVKKMVSFQMKSSEADLLHKLAMEDSLTGIKNRNAFNDYEQKLLKRDSGFCVFVHFDVNRLKKVNDTYGHAEGDKHIKAAATVIRKSFGDAGECFRIGGDEFFVILEGRKAKANYEAGIKKFMKFQEEYNNSENPKVPLEIAFGTAEYDCSMKNPEAAESLADSRMYEKKKLMKANSLKKNIRENLTDIKPPEFSRNVKKA